MLKDVKDLDTNLKLLLDSICPNLTASEAEVVMLHLLEFNGKIQETDEYKLADLKINVKTEFTFNGVVYKFREPLITETFGSEAQLLSALHISDAQIDFGKMPAFVIKWAEQITAPVSLKELVGSSAILDKLTK